jgi:hypothetical protein
MCVCVCVCVQEGEDEKTQRLAVVEQRYAEALEREAALRHERDSLVEWKVGVELGLPELCGPMQVVQGYRRLQQQLLLLEGEGSQLKQRIEAGSAKLVEARQAQEAALKRSAELDARVLQLQRVGLCVGVGVDVKV